MGTNIIESEHMRMIRERVSGPTWHRLIENERGEEGDSTSEKSEMTERSKCWRDPGMIRKLTAVREKVLTKQLKKAKDVFKREMKVVESTGDRCEIEKAWEEVKEVRREVWDKETPRVNRKIEHLSKKAGRCESHKICRELDNIYSDRMKEMKKKNEEDRLKILDRQPETMVKSPVKPEPGQVDNNDDERRKDPGVFLSSKYHSRPEDLSRLQREQVEILRMSQAFNKNWKESENLDNSEDSSEIMTFGKSGPVRNGEGPP